MESWGGLEGVHDAQSIPWARLYTIGFESMISFNFHSNPVKFILQIQD